MTYPTSLNAQRLLCAMQPSRFERFLHSLQRLAIRADADTDPGIVRCWLWDRLGGLDARSVDRRARRIVRQEGRQA